MSVTRTRKPWQLQLRIEGGGMLNCLGFAEWTTLRRYRFEKRARQALGDVTKGRMFPSWKYRLLRDEPNGPATVVYPEAA